MYKRQVMPRVKGLNMPRKRKRPVIEEVEEPEDVLESGDEESALGLSPSSSSASPTAPTTRGPSTVQVQQLQDAYEQKLLESEAAKEYAKEKKNELAHAERLFKAKLNRFGKAVDSGKGDPALQLERYYTAQLEMMKAELKQEVVKSVVLEAQSAAWEALAKLREAENKALRARAAA